MQPPTPSSEWFPRDPKLIAHDKRPPSILTPCPGAPEDLTTVARWHLIEAHGLDPDDEWLITVTPDAIICEGHPPIHPWMAERGRELLAEVAPARWTVVRVTPRATTWEDAR